MVLHQVCKSSKSIYNLNPAHCPDLTVISSTKIVQSFPKQKFEAVAYLLLEKNKIQRVKKLNIKQTIIKGTRCQIP